MRKVYLILFVAIFSACEIDLLDDHFELPWTNRMVVLTDSRTLSNSGNQVNVEFDMIVLQAKIFSSLPGSYTASEAIEDIIQPYDGITEQNIEFNAWDDEPYSFSLNSVNYNSGPGGNSQAISMGLLLDVSEPGSYGGFGFNNYYLEGLIGMIEQADPGDEFLLAKFRRRTQSDPTYELITDEFTTYSEELHIELSNLPFETRDASPLYNAIYDMIDEVAQKANHQEKHLVVFTSSLGTAWNDIVTIQEIVDKAILNDVKISIIWRSNDGISDWNVVSRIPMLTGGFSAYDGNGLTGGANTVFFKAFDILRGNLPYYTVSATVTEPNSTIPSPFSYQNYFRVFAEEQNIDGKGSSFYLNHPVIYHIE